MEKMIVVVLQDEKKVYEASQALNQLDWEGSITVHAQAVLTKNADGTVTVKDVDGDFPIRTVGGTAIGSLIGLIGGPIGLGVGAVAGAIVGSFGDLFVAGVGSDFVAEVSAALIPGTHAVVADISEEWITPVDTRMETLGGFVFRTSRRSFEDEQIAREIAQAEADIAQLKSEYAQARAERKAKLQAKIDQLTTRLQQKLEHARQRSQQIKAETDAKVQALQKKAAKAQGAAKQAIDARVKQVKEQYEQSVARVKSMVA